VRESAPITSIATSHAQNDSGLFELNFNDERFLPFEGAGAVSQWTIDLPPEHNQFDLGTVSDVILHVRYSAEQGSTALTNAARANLATIVPRSGVRMFVLNREFAAEWQRFLDPADGADQELVVEIERKHLPFRARTATTLRISRLDLIVDSDLADSYHARLQFAGGTPTGDLLMPRLGGAGEPHHLVVDPVAPPANLLGPLSLRIRRSAATDFRSLPADDLGDAYLIVSFSTS
jgi:hypothetical protein